VGFLVAAEGVYDQLRRFLGGTAALDLAGLAQRIVGLICVTLGRRDLRDHGGLTVAPYETLAQDQGEFALALVDLVFIGVKSPDALLKGQQALVDLGPVEFGLLGHVYHI